MSSCTHCNQHPCLWDVNEDSILEEALVWKEHATNEGGIVPANNLIRKKCYQVFITIHHGYLGRGKREKIPLCVTTGIRVRYPDSNENYMGFKDE